MKALLICPQYADALWTYKHARKFLGKKASSPPVGLLTVAALLPVEWEKRFVDMNVNLFTDVDLAWADIILIGAMLAQQASTLQVIQRCHALGKKMLAGGPLFCPELIEQGLFSKVDHIVVGEAEALVLNFLVDLTAGCARPIYRQEGYPDIRLVPTPMWSLVDLRDYAMINIQFVRGCPFHCDFCYGHILNGHHPRAKSKEQIVAELDAVHASGWRSSIFVCDDNLVGNHELARTHLLPILIEWMQVHDYPFTLTGAASVDLARDPQLMDMIVAAGFESITLGIESPNESSLTEVQKRQNLHLDLLNVVHTIQAYGLEVQSGMILGFDHDPPAIFDLQIDFLQQSGIANALVSILFAFPDTALYNRLKQENRLLDYEVRNSVHGAINFKPRMSAETLIAGYKRVLGTLYTPSGYYTRLESFLLNYRPAPRRFHLQFSQLGMVLRAVFYMGVLDPWRGRFLVLLFQALGKGQDVLVAYLRLAIMGYFLRQDIAEYAPLLDL
jgi:radical SAM superfamily enzyme YgiQ (UPF0313 family)